MNKLGNRSSVDNVTLPDSLSPPPWLVDHGVFGALTLP